MSRNAITRALLSLTIVLLAPLRFVLTQGGAARAVKDFVYDID
jgi:hypothetical protein